MKKTVVITGGNKGIGIDISRVFAEAGYEVFVGARENTNYLNELGKNVHFIKTDVRLESDHLNLVKAAIKETGRLDTFINNAGFSEWRSIGNIDEKFLNTYWADGLVVSTPTGSTGYSLSCGGPIIMPGTNNIIITPNAPHNLNVRPIVINDRSIIKLKVEDRDQLALVSLDSRSRAFDSETELIIKKADFKIRLIQPQNNSFTSTIRSKLMWGLDKRS